MRLMAPKHEAMNHTARWTIHPGEREGLENNAAWYFDMLSIPTGPSAKKLLETNIYVPTALKMANIYQVLPTLEEVDNVPCHVVSSGWDTLWIDHQHGFSLRRQVVFRKTGLKDPGCLNYVRICKDFVEADKGIWLPKLCYRLDYTTQLEPEHLRGKLTAVNKVTVSDLRVNNVPDSLFEVKFPPGTEVQNLVLNKSYYVPHGEGMLDKAIAQGSLIINGKVSPLSPYVSQEDKRFPVLWFINCIILLIILCAVFIIRRRRKWRSRQG